MSVELALIAGVFAIVVAVINGCASFLIAWYTQNRADAREKKQHETAEPGAKHVQSPKRAKRLLVRMALGTLLQIAFCILGIWASFNLPEPNLNFQILRISAFCTGIAIALIFLVMDFHLYLSGKFIELFVLQYGREQVTTGRMLEVVERLVDDVRELKESDKTG